MTSQGNQPFQLDKDFIEDIKSLLHNARLNVTHQVNSIMLNTYFEIGKRIVEKEQQGNEQAKYGEFLIENLSEYLSVSFGKGFSKRNLELIRQFYLCYRNAKSPISQSLSWTHYVRLMRIQDVDKRRFYEIECETNNWSVRELNRQFDSALYQRLILSRDKEKIKELAHKGQIIEKPEDALKDPYVLEFVGLPEQHLYSENDLEQALIDKLEHFLLELGKGFTFVGRQVRFTFGEDHFRVDLVFYNRLLRCFVLIDLKIGKLKHQDLGQMQMYVNYYDRYVKMDDENKTIGIVLCKDKQDALVEITLPKDNNHIFASRYQTVLPSKEELTKLIKEKDL
jgi:predicted nuclease of restriction endonuclease-like (RecB) superfamily